MGVGHCKREWTGRFVKVCRDVFTSQVTFVNSDDKRGVNPGTSLCKGWNRKTGYKICEEGSNMGEYLSLGVFCNQSWLAFGTSFLVCTHVVFVHEVVFFF